MKVIPASSSVEGFSSPGRRDNLIFDLRTEHRRSILTFSDRFVKGKQED
jgi:hypothetical protein